MGSLVPWTPGRTGGGELHPYFAPELLRHHGSGHGTRIRREFDAPFSAEGNDSGFVWGAEGEIRTPTPLRALRPERSASACFATSACSFEPNKHTKWSGTLAK